MDKKKTEIIHGELTKQYHGPSPADFDIFLPWACTQLSVEVDVTIIRKVLNYVSAVVNERPKQRPRLKSKVYSVASLSLSSSHDTISSEYNMPIGATRDLTSERQIIIETIYDSNLHLVQLKFLRNDTIPRTVMKIIGLIIQFHPTLSSITINSGLQKEAMYDISQFLPVSRITEICLDCTFLIEANYHILLNKNSLKHLSLSKCNINDAVVKMIASELVYPSLASKTLSILNLATNSITDLGVSYLADALRTNRHLSYLNLADNVISDKGAISLFNSLIEFPLTDAEAYEKSGRLMAYLKEKTKLVLKTVKDLQAAEFDQKANRRRSIKPLSVSQQKKLKTHESSVENKILTNTDALYYERAKVIVEGILGLFTGPFSPENTENRNGVLYCYGNNSLCYLNVAYNNLTYASIKKLYEVLLTQQFLCRKPKGLINVMIEGNFLPESCRELQQIDHLLEAGLKVRKISGTRRKEYSSKSTST